MWLSALFGSASGPDGLLRIRGSGRECGIIANTDFDSRRPLVAREETERELTAARPPASSRRSTGVRRSFAGPRHPPQIHFCETVVQPQRGAAGLDLGGRSDDKEFASTAFPTGPASGEFAPPSDAAQGPGWRSALERREWRTRILFETAANLCRDEGCGFQFST